MFSVKNFFFFQLYGFISQLFSLLTGVLRCKLVPRVFIQLIKNKREQIMAGSRCSNATKAIGLISKTTILHVHHAFLYISLPSLHHYDVKMPNFTMYRGSTQATTRFSLSF